jgi:hypothetical protein
MFSTNTSRTAPKVLPLASRFRNRGLEHLAEAVTSGRTLALCDRSAVHDEVLLFLSSLLSGRRYIGHSQPRHSNSHLEDHPSCFVQGKSPRCHQYIPWTQPDETCRQPMLVMWMGSLCSLVWFFWRHSIALLASPPHMGSPSTVLGCTITGHLSMPK